MGGSLILGIILVGVGLAGLVGWGVIWPLALIVIGLAILLNSFRRQQ